MHPYNNKIYIMGGLGRCPLATIEAFEPYNSKFNKLKPIPTRMFDAECTHKRTIAGGVQAQKGRIQKDSASSLEAERIRKSPTRQHTQKILKEVSSPASDQSLLFSSNKKNSMPANSGLAQNIKKLTAFSSN